MLITSSPSNKYEKQMLDILCNDDYFKKYPNGEKSIIYELTVSTKKKMCFDYENVDIRKLLMVIAIAYKKSPNIEMFRVINNCVKAVSNIM